MVKTSHKNVPILQKEGFSSRRAWIKEQKDLIGELRDRAKGALNSLGHYRMNPRRPKAYTRAAECYNDMAKIYEKIGDKKDALSALRLAGGYYESALHAPGDVPPNIVRALHNMARAEKGKIARLERELGVKLRMPLWRSIDYRGYLTSVGAGLFFILSVLFFSKRIIGYSFVDVSESTGNYLGLAFLAAAIILAAIYFKRK